MRKRAVALLAGAFLIGGAALPAAADPPAADPTDPAAVQEFMDRVIPEQLERLRIPGAAVSVVAGGKQVFAGGYGMADLETQQPVVADSTTFPIDSVSKLFTGTAVMQLVERDELDLDRDVNDYLTSFDLPDAFPGRPITLAHLLTHTAGFEELNVGSFDDSTQQLGEYLAANQPALVRPPGLLPSYSNYGIALAGYLVELRSGTPFEEYVDQHILQPLGMADTTFEQSDSARAALTKVYRPDGDGNTAVEPSYDLMAPAGSAVATVTDLSKFMLAHLQDGQLGGARILDEDTAVQMHSRQFGTDPRLPGMAYAFYESVLNGQQAIEHGGDGSGSHGALTLFPEQDVGLYVVVNGDGVDIGGSAGVHLVQKLFAEHFLPSKPTAQQPIAAGQAGDLAGDYTYTRISRSDASRILATAIVGVTVTANPDGSLTTAGQVSSDPGLPSVLRWLPVGDRLYQVEGGNELLAFQVDDYGEVVSFAISSDATVAWERLSWWESPGVHLGLSIASLAVLLTAFGWPIAAAVRRVRRRPATDRPGGLAVVARPLAGATIGLIVAFLGVGAYLVVDLNRYVDAVLGGTWVLTVLLTFPFVAAIGTVGMVGSAALAWLGRWWTIGARLHYSAITIAAVAFLSVAWEYNFLAWPWA